MKFDGIDKENKPGKFLILFDLLYRMFILFFFLGPMIPGIILNNKTIVDYFNINNENIFLIFGLIWCFLYGGMAIPIFWGLICFIVPVAFLIIMLLFNLIMACIGFKKYMYDYRETCESMEEYVIWFVKLIFEQIKKISFPLWEFEEFFEEYESKKVEINNEQKNI